MDALASGPMKDVEAAKSRGELSAGLAGDLRMGQPGPGDARVTRAEPIGGEEGTGGTETSQYPEEKKSTEIP